MLNEDQLRDLLHSSETHWVERKKSFYPSSVKEVIVAFANSVPENQHAVLFIGIGPDGRFVNIEKADEKQRDIRKIAEDECFPPIRCTPAIIRENGQEVVAVVVEFSKDRPHFAGAPFVRVGSETIRDRQKLRALLEDLIASRNDKARRILRDKGKVVSVVSISPPMRVTSFGGDSRFERGLERMGPQRKYRECRVEECDAFIVRCVDIKSGEIVAAALEKVVIGYDVDESRTQLRMDLT